MKDALGRRGFLKYLLALGTFGITSLLGFKKEEGFYVGKRKGFSIRTPEALGKCGASLDCAGGQGDSPSKSSDNPYRYPSGGGKCGASLDCTGGGGKCGASLDCAGN